jgi:hypothetical protein
MSRLHSSIALLAVCACTSRGRADRAASAHPDVASPTASAPVDAPPPSTAPSGPTYDGPFFVADPNARAVPIRRPDAPNMRYASLDRDTCQAELTRRGAPFVVAEATAGVLAPVRLRGPLRGIAIHTDRSPKERERSKYEVFDCRLLLALDDFAQLVAQHDVIEIIHFNAYRPTTEHGCTAKYWGLQHCAALAVDVREFKRKDGSTLNVERDFHGRIGLGTCATGVGPSPQTHPADELWSFVCDAAGRALFNVMLTPNYNSEHRNHFHLEITPDAGWMMIK